MDRDQPYERVETMVALRKDGRVDKEGSCCAGKATSTTIWMCLDKSQYKVDNSVTPETIDNENIKGISCRFEDTNNS